MVDRYLVMLLKSTCKRKTSPAVHPLLCQPTLAHLLRCQAILDVRLCNNKVPTTIPIEIWWALTQDHRKEVTQEKENQPFKMTIIAGFIRSNPTIWNWVVRLERCMDRCMTRVSLWWTRVDFSRSRGTCQVRSQIWTTISSRWIIHRETPIINNHTTTTSYCHVNWQILTVTWVIP